MCLYIFFNFLILNDRRVLHATPFRSGFIRFFGAHYIRAAKRYTALHIPHTAACGLLWGYRETVSSRHIPI